MIYNLAQFCKEWLVTNTPLLKFQDDHNVDQKELQRQIQLAKEDEIVVIFGDYFHILSRKNELNELLSHRNPF